MSQSAWEGEHVEDDFQKLKESIISGDAVAEHTLIEKLLGGGHAGSVILQAGLRESVKVMVGGVPVTQRFADEIGVDAHGPNAAAAVEQVKQPPEVMHR